MKDAVTRRHDRQVVEGLVAPVQECKTFGIALALDGFVIGQCAGIPPALYVQRVVHDEMSRGYRVYLAWIAACFCYCVTQTGQIDQCRSAEQVLQNHTGGAKWDVAVFRASANHF
ncbi:hypothetical protein D3C76_1175160 [compost metagenome]